MTETQDSFNEVVDKMEHMELDQVPNHHLNTREALKTSIRQQVEYYFSDRNLITDGFLKGKMRGRKNRPVPLELIHGFRKMRAFQPFSVVVEAVKESELLNVVSVDGKECVQRKTPFIQSGHEVKKPKPTGFELNWTEAPITPSEHAEDRKLYDSSEKSFAERMETALHRYRSRRRFVHRVGNIYTKFLAYGGVDTGHKQYSGGLSKEDLEDKDAEEISTMAAIDFIGDDKLAAGPGQKWDVDFEAVAKGFLSSHVPLHFDPRTDIEVNEIVNVLCNFYNYLLLHDVCPEYKESILAAREICKTAERELKLTIRAIKVFPGNFQMACSTLFGGHFQGLYAEDEAWYQDFKGQQHRTYMSQEEAKKFLASAVDSPGLAHLFSDPRYLYEESLRLTQKITETEITAGLEVVQIIPPNKWDTDSSSAPSKPQGRLLCRPWELPANAYLDPTARRVSENRPEHYTFAVGQEVLECCFEGMKFETTINTLNSGLKFFDNVIGVYCSFFSIPYNEILRREKKARDDFNEDE